jgi:hypothetical protein
MGLAVTPEYEELLAKGYPYLRRLVTPHPDEEQAENTAQMMLCLGDPAEYFVDWPAAVARRYVRGYAASAMVGGDYQVMFDAAQDPGPVDEAEGRQLIGAMLEPEHYQRYEFHVHHALFLLEAMIGSEAVVDAALTAYEGMADLDGTYSTRNDLAYALGFVIERLPATAQANAKARVQALVDKHADRGKVYTRDFLSYLVGGREALERSGRTLGLYCVHFCNDPELIRSIAADSVTAWDVQHVVRAGEPLLDALTAKSLRQIWAPWRPLVAEQLGVLASPKAVRALKELGQTKKLAPQVTAILAARGETLGAATKKKPPATKSSAKKPSANKPRAKKSSAKKPPTKKPPAKKSSAKKSPAKKSSAKKSSAKKSPAKKSSAKKPPAKKPPANKPSKPAKAARA